MVAAYTKREPFCGGEFTRRKHVPALMGEFGWVENIKLNAALFGRKRSDERSSSVDRGICLVIGLLNGPHHILGYRVT